jgi:hypothetical protein
LYRPRYSHGWLFLVALGLYAPAKDAGSDARPASVVHALAGRALDVTWTGSPPRGRNVTLASGSTGPDPAATKRQRLASVASTSIASFQAKPSPTQARVPAPNPMKA